MPIIVCGAAAGDNVLVQVDDPTVWEDEDVAMPTPYYVSADADQGPAGGSGRLRQIIQAVTIAGATSIKVTPIANGVLQTDQAETFALVTTDGSEQRIEHFVASMATRHAVRVEVTSFAAAVTFGESDLVMVPRRSTENA